VELCGRVAGIVHYTPRINNQKLIRLLDFTVKSGGTGAILLTYVLV
jgi:hypothetical protein